MKMFKLIAAMSLVTITGFGLSGCSPFGKNQDQSESSSDQSTDPSTEQSISSTTENSTESSTSENISISQKNPIDIFIDAKEKFLSETDLDLCIRISSTEDEKEQVYDTIKKVKQHDLYFCTKLNSELQRLNLKKDDYVYYAIGDTYKIKSKGDSESYNADIEETKNALKKAHEEQYSCFTRENIKEIKEESNDGTKTTFAVELNDNSLLSSLMTGNYENAKIKVVINNNDASLADIIVNDIVESIDEKQITTSYHLIINAIGDNVTPIELPDDVDSYKDAADEPLDDDDIETDDAENPTEE